MRVGVISTNASPYVIRNGDNYSGIAIDIWEIIAKKEDFEFSYVEVGPDEENAIKKLQNKEVDILVGPYTITSKRYQHIGYTLPFYYSDIALASSRQTNNLENYINISKTLGSIMFLFIFILFINNFINNFNKNASFAEFFINAIPNFKDRKMYLLYAIILGAVFVLYINTYNPNLNLNPVGLSIYSKNVIYNEKNETIDKILKKYNAKGTFVEVKDTANHQKQIQENEAFDSYIENKDTQYGIVDDSSKLAYVLHHNIKKYEGIRIIEHNLAKTLYAFIVPKGSDYLDRINSALRDAQKEKINQIIVTKYLGPKFENHVSF
jgi:ABC-type amino acid transport substrate-binding protein